MNLPQAVSFPPQLRIDWDLSRRILLVEEGELEPAVVGCSIARSASFPCGASAIQAGAQRQDQAFPE